MGERESIEVMVARIDERTKSMDEKINTLFDLRKDDKRSVGAITDRLSLLEKWRAGILAVLGFVAVMLGFITKAVF